MSILPVKDFNPGLFCCGGWNGSACNFFTSGNNPDGTNPSPAPFQLANGAIIFNRTSGSTGSNNTISVATVTVTATPNPPPQTTSSNNEAAVGAGIGVPLGVLLAASLVLLWTQRKRVKMLERRLADSSLPAEPKLKPRDQPHEMGGQTYEMDGHTLIELGPRD